MRRSRAEESNGATRVENSERPAGDIKTTTRDWKRGALKTQADSLNSDGAEIEQKEHSDERAEKRKQQNDEASTRTGTQSARTFTERRITASEDAAERTKRASILAMVMTKKGNVPG